MAPNWYTCISEVMKSHKVLKQQQEMEILNKLRTGMSEYYRYAELKL
jgi:hypothetical protein